MPVRGMLSRDTWRAVEGRMEHTIVEGLNAVPEEQRTAFLRRRAGHIDSVDRLEWLHRPWQQTRSTFHPTRGPTHSKQHNTADHSTRHKHRHWDPLTKGDASEVLRQCPFSRDFQLGQQVSTWLRSNCRHWCSVFEVSQETASRQTTRHQINNRWSVSFPPLDF